MTESKDLGRHRELRARMDGDGADDYLPDEQPSFTGGCRRARPSTPFRKRAVSPPQGDVDLTFSDDHFRDI